MKLDYHGDSGIVEPRGNVRIQTRTPAQSILSAIAIFHQQSFRHSRGPLAKPCLSQVFALRFGLYFFFWAAASAIACIRSMVG